MIAEVLDGLAASNSGVSAAEAAIGERVLAMCARFPIYAR